MTITTRRFILEVVGGSHVYVKIGRREMFVSFERNGGPAGRRVVIERGT